MFKKKNFPNGGFTLYAVPFQGSLVSLANEKNNREKKDKFLSKIIFLQKNCFE